MALSVFQWPSVCFNDPQCVSMALNVVQWPSACFNGPQCVSMALSVFQWSSACLNGPVYAPELGDQQKSLAERMRQQEDHLRNCAAARRLYEADTQKVERWCRETDVTCGPDLPTDCAIEVLEEQVQQYKVRHVCGADLTIDCDAVMLDLEGQPQQYCTR